MATEWEASKLFFQRSWGKTALKVMIFSRFGIAYVRLVFRLIVCAAPRMMNFSMLETYYDVPFTNGSRGYIGSGAHRCVCVDLQRSPCFNVATPKRKTFSTAAARHINDYIFGKIYLSHSHSLTHPFKTRISTAGEWREKMLFGFFFARYTPDVDARKAEKRCWLLSEEPRFSWDRRLGKRSCAQIEIRIILLLFSMCEALAEGKIFLVIKSEWFAYQRRLCVFSISQSSTSIKHAVCFDQFHPKNVNRQKKIRKKLQTPKFES